jgi:putative ABC transport system substrate-binding protein
MANRLAALLDRTLGESVIAPQAQQHAQAAWSLGVEVRPVYIGSVDDLEPAFDAMRRDGVEAVSGVDGGVAVSNARRVADLALQHRLPTIFLNPVLARAGALMSYGVDQAELYRRAVGYVDKVLNGADPAELPVEQPDKFHFVINLRTAQALSLTIPEVVLQQATEVIQ